MTASAATYRALPFANASNADFKSVCETSESSPNRFVTRHELFEDAWAAIFGFESVAGTESSDDDPNSATPVWRYTDECQKSASVSEPSMPSTMSTLFSLNAVDGSLPTSTSSTFKPSSSAR